MAHRLDIKACNPETGEVWGINELSAIADIHSELGITREEAKDLLVKSNIDNPIKLRDVEFWMENENE